METTIEIVECKRTTKTRSGNPRFIIKDAKGKTYRTESDGAGVFIIVDGRTGWADVHINHQGRITQAEYL